MNASQPGNASQPPRLCPERGLPPYSYVSGHFPHPLRDPAGHLFGHEPQEAAALDAGRWRESREYLYALDLFNYGYYWEAHEVWEALWHAAGRRGPMADFLKALIKLAAAGVKLREGRPGGVKRHARRAQELFVSAKEGAQVDRIAGFRLTDLIGTARRIEEIDAPAEPRPTATFNIRLLPERVEG